jgi:hypothetical protein
VTIGNVTVDGEHQGPGRAPAIKGFSNPLKREELLAVPFTRSWIVDEPERMAVRKHVRLGVYCACNQVLHAAASPLRQGVGGAAVVVKQWTNLALVCKRCALPRPTILQVECMSGTTIVTCQPCPRLPTELQRASARLRSS